METKISQMRERLEGELARLQKRKAEGHTQEWASLDGSILTVRKIIGWLK